MHAEYSDQTKLVQHGVAVPIPHTEAMRIDVGVLNHGVAVVNKGREVWNEEIKADVDEVNAKTERINRGAHMVSERSSTQRRI